MEGGGPQRSGALTCWLTYWLSLFLVTSCWQAVKTVSLVLGSSAWLPSGVIGWTRPWFPTCMFIRVTQELLKNRGSRGHIIRSPAYLVISFFFFFKLPKMIIDVWKLLRKSSFAFSLTIRLFQLRIFLSLLVALTAQHPSPAGPWTVTQEDHYSVCSLYFTVSFRPLPELTS